MVKPPRPILMALFTLPYGIALGWAAGTLPIVLEQHGFFPVPAAMMAAFGLSLAAWQILPAPIVDGSFSLRRWYIIGLALCIFGIFPFIWLPLQAGMLEDEFRNWQQNFEIKDFKKEFKLDYVVIPNPATNPARWELTFTTTHDENHNFTIDFIDDEPQGVSIDGYKAAGQPTSSNVSWNVLSQSEFYFSENSCTLIEDETLPINPLYRAHALVGLSFAQ